MYSEFHCVMEVLNSGEDIGAGFSDAGGRVRDAVDKPHVG
jgi:hypothetical protein